MLGQQLPSSHVASNTKELIEQLYPTLAKDPSLPPFTSEDILSSRVSGGGCGDFSPKRAAPPNNNQPTPIDAVFSVERLVHFSDVDETMKVSAMFWLNWKVDTCNGNETLYENGLQRLFTPKTMTINQAVWLPGYIFTSSSVDIFMKGQQFGSDLVATVENNDNATSSIFTFYYVRRGFFEAQCSLDLSKFPFDSQTCAFTFAMERSTTLVNFNDVIAMCPEQDTTEWKFDLCRSSTRIMKISGNNVSAVDFVVSLTRIPDFYVINLALPSICLSLLELATFVMPPEKPDRPTFAVTIVLALTVAQSDVLKDVPKTSGRILLSDYILLLSWFSALVTFYEMVACWLSNYGDSKKYLKKQLKAGRATCSVVRAVDLIAFLLALTLYGGIQVYAYLTINGTLAL